MNRASVEICRLCKIKPKVIQDYELNDIELYPDFLEPENFFKLMKIRVPTGSYRGATLLRYINCRPSKRCSTFADYIKALLLVLNGQSTLSSEAIESLKHRLRCSKWKYEGDD